MELEVQAVVHDHHSSSAPSGVVNLIKERPEINLSNDPLSARLHYNFSAQSWGLESCPIIQKEET